MLQKFRNPACTFLRKLISPYGHGSKDASGYRRPTNQALLTDYNRTGFVRGLANAQMLDHFRGEATHYFWTDGRIKTTQALICIDIDNHKVGSLDAALAFARHLQATFFPGLYFEPSTNGRGVHGYVIIDKRGFGDERLHGLCKMLDRALKVVHQRWRHENPDMVVEGVEIKGHPPRITWTRDGRMKDLISGQFAKLPRELLSRIEEFKKTTVLDDLRISQLYLTYKEDQIVSKKPVVEPTGTRGSLTGCVVKQSNLDRWVSYLNVARALVDQPLKTTGREVATAKDMAVLLLILEACTDDMNADGSMPTARIKENWDILFANGDVERPWCPRQYTALRNHLSTQGFVEWEDRRYVPAALSLTGEGRAAKWRASESLTEKLAEAKLGLGTSIVVDGEGNTACVDELGDGVHGIREREEDLYCDKTSFIHDHKPLPDWIIAFRQPECIRPLLNAGVERFLRAA